MKYSAVVFLEREGVTRPIGNLLIIEDSRANTSLFTYGKRYAVDPDAVSLDPVQMPIGPPGELISTPQDFALFNGIRDAAPDAWGRKLIDMYSLRHQGRPANEAEFLLASQSGNRGGAIRFGPTHKAPGPVVDLELPPIVSDLGTIEAFQDMVDMMLRGEEVPESVLACIAPGTDLGGARPKATLMHRGEPWLVKFGLESDRINSAAAEAACLDLCEKAGLPVPDRMVAEVAGRPALFLKRFDRELIDGQIQRRHMISGLTITGSHEMDRGTKGYADLWNGMRRFGVSADSGEEIYRRMVMNVLIGNTDDHLRNHAFLLGAHGRYDMAPTYDVTPSLQATSSRRLFLHLGVAGSGREAMLERAVGAGPDLGVQKERAVEIAQDLQSMVFHSWEQAMTERGCSSHDIEMLQNSFSEASNPLQKIGNDADEFAP